MNPVSGIVDAYINVNILFVVLLLVCYLARLLCRIVGLQYTYSTQLRLFYGAFLVVLVSPALTFLFTTLAETTGLTQSYSVNLSDFVVAQYLQGNLEMKPTQLEQILGLRQRLVGSLFNMQSNLGLVFVALLFGGMIVFAARLVLGMYRLKKIIAKSFVWRCFGSVELRLSDTTNIPFSTRGLRRRIVVIPSHMLAHSDDLKIALGHEFQHLRQYDIEWEVALEFLKPLFFWNPAYYIWKGQVEQLRELSCDQKVVARKGYNVAAYCYCLLRVCHNNLRRRKLLQVDFPKVALAKLDDPLLGQKSAMILRNRMLSIIHGRSEKHSGVLFACLMIPLFVITLLASVAIEKPDDWSQDRLMLSSIVNLERLETYNGSTPQFGRRSTSLTNTDTH